MVAVEGALTSLTSLKGLTSRKGLRSTTPSPISKNGNGGGVNAGEMVKLIAAVALLNLFNGAQPLWQLIEQFFHDPAGTLEE